MEAPHAAQCNEGARQGRADRIRRGIARRIPHDPLARLRRADVCRETGRGPVRPRLAERDAGEAGADGHRLRRGGSGPGRSRGQPQRSAGAHRRGHRPDSRLAGSPGDPCPQHVPHRQQHPARPAVRLHHVRGVRHELGSAQYPESERRRPRAADEGPACRGAGAGGRARRAGAHRQGEGRRGEAQQRRDGGNHSIHAGHIRQPERRGRRPARAGARRPAGRRGRQGPGCGGRLDPAGDGRQHGQHGRQSGLHALAVAWALL